MTDDFHSEPPWAPCGFEERGHPLVRLEDTDIQEIILWVGNGTRRIWIGGKVRDVDDRTSEVRGNLPRHETTRRDSAVDGR